ncbi:S1 family peptidase [Rhodomicrobium sp.]|uniref:S1 family peptidase n=1 Tax=Rhodomicrobium sp. TaxID=2720632 RepID=UPI0039E4BD2B
MSDTIARNNPKELFALIDLLKVAIQENAYCLLINKELSKLPNFRERKTLLEMGHFSGPDLLQLTISCGAANGVSIQIMDYMLHKLIQWLLVSDSGLLGANIYARYRWNKERISLFFELDLIDNVLLGPAHVAQKYRQSVPAIFVKKDSDCYTGTGFLVANTRTKKQAIVTARHNVDHDKGIEFVEFDGAAPRTYRPIDSAWHLHPKRDLAIMPVEICGLPIPIYPLGIAQVLSRTITLGYPRIATTDAPYLLAHSGELNAVVKSYYDSEERLIISNFVAPGNSGGPVLDEAGLCVGMVVNAFETAHEGGVSKANAAIPSSSIHQFVRPFLS